MSLPSDPENNGYMKEVPTVIPVPATLFDAVADARALRVAMKGLGTNEKVIIDVLCQRSNAQRQAISEAFNIEFNRDLVADLKSEVSGKFKSVITSLMLPAVEYCAKELHEAIKQFARKEEALLDVIGLFGSESETLSLASAYETNVMAEILFTRSYEEVVKIANAYNTKYKIDLKRDIKHDISGRVRKIFLKSLQEIKDPTIDSKDKSDADSIASAQEEAKLLLYKGKEHSSTDENPFVNILSYAIQRRRLTLVIFQEYAKISGEPIEETLKSKVSEDILFCLLEIVKIVRNRPAYFAERLELAMRGLSTDHNTLIRIIVSRSEIDLANIKLEYERMYGKTLYGSVENATSGDYRRSLLALIGLPALNYEITVPPIFFM